MKNSIYFGLICALFFVLIKTATCLRLPELLLRLQPCDSICTPDVLPKSTFPFARQSCWKGCLLFRNCVHKSKGDMNSARLICQRSCETYDKDYNRMCRLGCDLMYQNREQFKALLSADDSNKLLAARNIKLITGFSDSSIFSRVDTVADYKIPEEHKKTMPAVENTYTRPAIKTSSDWLDCASKNSGIPRWVLLTAILAAVLIALFLSFSADKREESDADKNGKLDERYLIKNEFIPEKQVEVAALDVEFKKLPKHANNCEEV